MPNKKGKIENWSPVENVNPPTVKRWEHDKRDIEISVYGQPDEYGNPNDTYAVSLFVNGEFEEDLTPVQMGEDLQNKEKVKKWAANWIRDRPNPDL